MERFRQWRTAYRRDGAVTVTLRETTETGQRMRRWSFPSWETAVGLLAAGGQHKRRRRALLRMLRERLDAPPPRQLDGTRSRDVVHVDTDAPIRSDLLLTMRDDTGLEAAA